MRAHLRNPATIAESTLPAAPAWAATDWAALTHTVEIGPGQRISYVEVGSGPVILLLHGLGGSWQAWLENISSLSTDHRVIALDLPGFGQTAPFVGVLTPADYSRVVNRFCEALRLKAIIAVGSSFGGWIAAELTLHNPALVRALVLVDAAGIPPTRTERLKVVSLLRMTGRAAGIGCRYRHLVIDNPMVRKRSLSFMFHRPGDLSREMVSELLPQTPSPIFRAVLMAAVGSWSHSLCERIAELTTPALVIWGERDAQLPLRHAQEWHRLLKNSTLVTIPAAGHLPMIESPTLVNQALAGFINGLSETTANR